jgi:hypothetical protein
MIFLNTKAREIQSILEKLKEKILLLEQTLQEKEII